MHISWLRCRITIQKNETVEDQNGNHKSVWTSWFTCWATGSSNSRSSDEKEVAGHTVEADRVDFIIRWCSETSAIDAKRYRVLLGNRVYNITSVDPMDYRHQSLKLHTQLASR